METLDNKFIELFEDLYNKKYQLDSGTVDKVEEKEEPVQTEQPKRFFSRFKKAAQDFTVINTPDVSLCNSFDTLKTYLNDILSNPSQTFWTLWQVCQFLRWAEKVFLYDNNPDKDLFIDSAMDADERCIMFTFANTVFKIKLQLVSKPEVKLTEPAYNQVITILIQRQYGKKMENKYISVDGYADMIDDSDLYTLNQVNRFLNIKLREAFNSILGKLLESKVTGDLLSCKVEDILNPPVPYY